MKKKYCDQESVFAHVWDNADEDGLWQGDDATLTADFNASEGETYAVLSELCDRDLIERVGNSTYIVTRWRERDNPGEEEECS